MRFFALARLAALAPLVLLAACATPAGDAGPDTESDAAPGSSAALRLTAQESEGPESAGSGARPGSGAPFDPLEARAGGPGSPAGTEAPAALARSSGTPAVLPGGRRTVFGGRSFLVAYYGTAGTGALGVLGETRIAVAHRRLMRAAAPFRRRGERIQPVYELIVTVADARPGKDGDYSHDIARSAVRRYVRAAHRNGALLLLDVQPGRSSFPSVAKRWEWALRDPYVGLALDPEWRMGPRQVPARVIGSVGAREVNRTSAWLARLVRRYDLPQKLFALHQFRTSMVRDIGQVQRRSELASVQHVDGFGTPGQKLATYHAVLRPRLFTPGFKLFYDEDRRLMSPARVRRIRPPVRFVSYQ